MDTKSDVNNSKNDNINSYEIVSNNNGTYKVSIETDARTLVYPRAFVTFGANESIAFPVRIQVLDKDDEPVLDFGLNISTDNNTGGDKQA